MEKALSLTDQTREVVTSLYAAAVAGEFEKFPHLFDENVVVIEPSFLPWGGRYENLAAFTKCAGQIALHMDLSTIKVEHILANGNEAVAFSRLKTIKHDSDVEVAEWLELRDGKIVKVKIHFHQLGSLVSLIK